MYKIDLKDAYFSITKICTFFMEQQSLGIVCLCFGLAPAPRIFTKLLKVAISILRKINIRVVIYLDDLLIMGCSKKEVVQARDTVVFLLQHLGFVINQKKCVFSPVQEIVFLGLLVNSKNMTLSLIQEKLLKVINNCSEMLKKQYLQGN